MKEFDFKDVEDLLKGALKIFTDNWIPLCVSCLLGYFVPLMVYYFFQFGLMGSAPMLAETNVNIDALYGMLIGLGVGWFLLICVISLYSVGIINYSIKLCRGENPMPKDFFLPITTYLKLIAAGILLVIAYCIGFVLCFIPGFLVAFFTSLVMYIIIDRNELGVIDSIKYSCTIIKENWKVAIVTFLILYVIQFVLGCTMVGMIPAYPFGVLVTALLYLKLHGASSSAAEPQNEIPPTVQY
ncbi:MAG: hypothetical protein J6Z01_11045 [Bacteroidales bacterium]|nr:hypothetical protein [Bacteroidales bacterium]